MDKIMVKNRQSKVMGELNKKIKRFLYLRDKKLRNKINMDRYTSKLREMKDEIIDIERTYNLLPNAWIKAIILKTIIETELQLMNLQS